ncbi:MAG: PH domain-containing protein, partial [Clostridia bacterium]|nr:PH domain-containing protein [Clostridia bacterium]
EINGFFKFEFLVFGVIIAIAALRCMAFRVSCDNDSVYIRTGILFIKRCEIQISKLSSVQTARNPFDVIFGSVTFRINTEAGTYKRSDFEFKLRFSDAKELSKMLYGGEEVSKQRFSPIKVAIMAAATSSAFTGMIIGVPIINRAGNLLGIALSEMLLDEINNVSAKIETHFPPIVNTVSLVLLLGYAISFIYSFLKFVNFRVIMGEKKLEVCSGFFTRVRTAFKRSSVNDVKIEQTALMLLLKRYSLKVSVGGFGDPKSESQVMVPSGRYGEIKKDFSFYFPFLTPQSNYIEPKRSLLNQSRFLFWPSVLLIVVLAVSISSAIIFDEFTRFIFFLTFVALCFVFYYAYISLLEYKNGKICFGNNVLVQSKRGLRTCEMYCPKEKIGQIRLLRVFTDFYYKTCKVRITLCSESADSIQLRHIDYETAKQEILNSFNISE